MLDVGDERVGVGGHVCAEEARFVCYWVCCHFGCGSTVCVCVVLREGGSFANASGGRENSPALPLPA